MPSQLHEAFIELIRQRPAFIADLLSGPLKVELPDFQQARLDSIDVTDLTPTEYRADAVVTLAGAAGPVLAVVIEAQLARAREKRLTWPVYVTTLRARLRCTTTLVVLCADAGVARWCAEPIDVAYPDCVLTPIVLGPDLVPVVTDQLEARRSPEMAVLSLLAHGAKLTASDPRKEMILALLEALTEFDEDRQRLYYDLAFTALPVEAHRDLKEVLMTMSTAPEFRSAFLRSFFEERYAEGEAHGRAEGRATGEALAVIAFLEVRGIDLPETARDRILACTDLDQLEIWIRRTPDVSSVEELFA